MNLPTTLALLALAAGPFAHAGEIAQPPYSAPEYNRRFLADRFAPRPAPALTLHVAPGGDANATGTRTSPFASLEAARDAIRRLKRTSGLPAGGVHVVLLPGDYRITKPFVLDSRDSGTPEAPIVYRGENRRGVLLSGGREIDAANLKPVADAATLERLKPSARGHVLATELSATIARSFPGDGRYGMISMDGHLLTLAQWPNRGYHHIDRIIDGGPTTRWLKPGEQPAPYSKDNPTGGRFTFREELPPLVEREFARGGDIHAQGYFHNDWYFQSEPVGRVEAGVVQLLRHTRYGIADKIKSIPRRVRLVNVLAELDEPGEWFLDRAERRLYVWPIPAFDPATSRVVVLPTGEIDASAGLQSYSATLPTSTPADALLALDGASHITIRDLVIENSGDLAVRISGGEHNLLAACTVRNGANKGVAIEGGRRNGIAGCDFHDLELAFSISGGDFKSLERCYNFAVNNDVHSCRRRGYGMISLDGVGLHFAHNVLHDMNGAVSFKTVDALLEYNEFYNIGYEMGDFNVAYCGAVWFTMNNVVRHNFVHHLLEPGGHPVMPFRNDDGGAGLQIYGNVFYRSGRGGGQFAGPLNSFRNNLTLLGNTMWWTNKSPVTPEAVAAAWKGLEKFGRDLPRGDKGDNIYIMEQFLGEKGWLRSPWIDEFPELAEAIRVNPFAQTFGHVGDNYVHGVQRLFHIHGGSGTVEGMESKDAGRFVDLPREGTFILPREISLDAFVDVPALDFRFKDGFTPMAGFKPIPFERIGFVADEFRPDPPRKEEYRPRIHQRFLHDEGGRYDAAKVNARYPTPRYLR